MGTDRIGVRILEIESNSRGDLFGLLMSDLLLALGYENPRLNVQQPGREIDITATHRTEKRHVVAECKATASAIGGTDVNTFIGKLDAERKKHPQQETTGYFISLAGFTQTAIQQEIELGSERVVLLDGTRVVEELIAGNIIVSEDKAVELAGRCASGAVGLNLDSYRELLAHSVGWIWAIYFSKHKEVSHYALVHADGSLIGPELAKKIEASDSLVGGELHRLQYLGPPKDDSLSVASVGEARRRYFQFINQECGEIHLEGMPTDQEAGSRRLRLESLFVPVYLVPAATVTEDTEEEEEVGKRTRCKEISSSNATSRS